MCRESNCERQFARLAPRKWNFSATWPPYILRRADDLGCFLCLSRGTKEAICGGRNFSRYARYLSSTCHLAASPGFERFNSLLAFSGLPSNLESRRLTPSNVGIAVAPIRPAPYIEILSRTGLSCFTCKVRRAERERGKLLHPVRGQMQGWAGCGWQICNPEWDLSAPDVTTPLIPSEKHYESPLPPTTRRKRGAVDDVVVVVVVVDDE